MKSAVYFTWLIYGIFCIVFTSGQLAGNARAGENATITESNFSIVCNDTDIFRNECCTFVHNRFKVRWSAGGSYLTEYLTNLKNWNCVQFASECKTPIYDYTPFTRLVYDDFCNRSQLFSKCVKKILNIAKKYSITVFTAEYGDDNAPQPSETVWKNLTASLNPRQMEMEDLNEPCVQIAFFDRPEGGVGRFHEVVQPYMSFCDFTWAGYDIDTATERGVSPWTSWSIRCRASLVICMVVAACLSCAIIIANVIVICVYTTTPKLQNGQSVYKISIAISDLLSGLIVIPNAIILQYLLHINPRRMGGVIQTNVTEKLDLVRRLPGGEVRSIVPRQYIDFVGFFTFLSLTVSTYSLLPASFDRYWAISRPFEYNKVKANHLAKVVCVFVWAFAVLFSSIPFMVTNQRYKIILSMMVASIEMVAVVVLAVVLLAPLITLCGVNYAIFQSAREHCRARQRMKSPFETSTKEDSIDKRLNKVLRLMVGVFSVCILPLFFLLAIVSFFNNLSFNSPEKLDPKGSVVFNSMEYCAIYLFLSKSLWNCFIYTSRGGDFQKAAKSLRAVKVALAAISTVCATLRCPIGTPVIVHKQKNVDEPRVGAVASSNPHHSITLLSTIFPHKSRVNNDLSVQVHV